VPAWGVNEALRELFQNGIDRENEAKESKFHISYDPLARHLTLGNPDTYLHKRTLLLGETTKDGKSTIGKYGEGYKLALLVLLRCGCRITIENGKEVWEPRIVKSRVFDSELVQIDVTKNKNESNGLFYYLDGITPVHYSSFQDQCLLFDPERKVVDTRQGEILLDEKYAGKVYCNTLLVCTVDNLMYGYNMKPAYLSLDRDRKKVSEFNLTWETSRMWAESSVDHIALSKMLKANAIDVGYYHTHAHKQGETYKKVCDMYHEDFLKTYGVHAVVCKTAEEVEVIKKKYKNLVPVIVPEKEYIYIRGCASYSSRKLDTLDNETPESFVRSWLSSDRDEEKLLTEAKKWSYVLL